METRILTITDVEAQADVIAEAAELLRRGELVAFPTETVYGLGANALDPDAVQKIYLAKGRPSNNPLIVHVPDIEAAKQLTTDWTANAERLARHFWAGSLTLIVRRSPLIPDIVTGGGDTVGLRIPAHPVALALLQCAGLPLAAPSANRSMSLSPTTAAHVKSGLDGRIPLILDGGATPGGIESTVIDVSGSVPRLLRPGLISLAELEAVIGHIEPLPDIPLQNAEPHRSPGMMARHYAPNSPLELVSSSELPTRIHQLTAQNLHLGVLALSELSEFALDAVKIVSLPQNPADYAARLYAVLHDLDVSTVDRILVETTPDTAEWLAVRDRLQRAATPL